MGEHRVLRPVGPQPLVRDFPGESGKDPSIQAKHLERPRSRLRRPGTWQHGCMSQTEPHQTSIRASGPLRLIRVSQDAFVSFDISISCPKADEAMAVVAALPALAAQVEGGPWQIVGHRLVPAPTNSPETPDARAGVHSLELTLMRRIV